MRTGTSSLPLHGGQCPAWLFVHMKALCAAIVEVIIEDAGVEEVLRRLSDPYWFQALGCVAGFDWHSSGVTTTVCGALKEGLKNIGPEAGLFMAGGKGASSRKTPLEIAEAGERYHLKVDAGKLAYTSRITAKVDSSAVQDGYQIYHHFFVFTGQGSWAVIQQGMNPDIRMARRYHWLEETMPSFTADPHAAICCDQQAESLNLVAHDNQSLQEACVQLSRERPEKTTSELLRITNSLPALHLRHCHPIPRSSYINRALTAAYEQQADDFEALLKTEGLGAGTLRALCLVAEVAFGVQVSRRDPVRYAFAHGGKDGYPFPVNESDIENSYNTLNRALRKARTGQPDRMRALKRLAAWHEGSAALNTSQWTQTLSPLFPPMREQSIIEPGTRKSAKKEAPLLVQDSLF